MSKTIYIAGPMEGITVEQMTGWRNEFKDKLSGYGITILDPTRRMPFHSKDGIDRARFIFQKDLKDIDASDIVFFDIRYNAGRGTGTSMEAMYAWMKMKPIITWDVSWN
jgi:nucleoside 2-deoxyribosyltransferase